jgi:hypothetical protein
MLLARCDEGGDVKVHFGELNRLYQIMAGMGAIVDDEDYTAIIMGSLPDIYQISSTLEGAVGYSSKVVTAQELLTAVNVEYEHRLLRNPQSARKDRNATLHAGNSTRQGRGEMKDTICYNCNMTGHFKMDCWSKGGRKEGRRPTGQGRRNGGKTAANTAAAAPTPSPDNYAFATSVQVGRGGTIIDSGATSHFCPDRAKFITFEAIKAQDVRTADRTTISVLGQGDIKVHLPLSNKYTTVTLKSTLHTPKMALTLISVHQITAAGFTVQFENDACKIISPAPKRKLIALIAQVNGLYAIPAQTEESAHVAKLTINELHHALGHVAQDAIQYAIKQGLIEGVELDSASTLEFCEACMKAKATHQPFPKKMVNRARTYGELVHTDLWGPAQTESVAGHLYYISFTDDFSWETKVRFLKLKSEALSALKDYEMELKCQTPGAKIKKALL